MVSYAVVQELLWTIIYGLGALILIGVIGFFVYRYFTSKKKYDIRAIIWERDGFDQITQDIDDASVYVDSNTKNKRLYLRRQNVGLVADQIPIIRNQAGKKYVYVTKYGLKNFSFVRMNISPNPGFSATVGEEDVNWAINAYERAKKLFTQSLLWQVLPYIGIALMGIFIVIMLSILLKEFKNLGPLAEALKEAAQAYAAGQGRTVITKGG